MGLPSNFSASKSSNWATAWSRNCLILLERPIVTFTGVGKVVTMSSWIVGVELVEETLLMLAEPEPFFGLLGDFAPLLSFRLGPLLKIRFIVQGFRWSYLIRTAKNNMRLSFCSILSLDICVMFFSVCFLHLVAGCSLLLPPVSLAKAIFGLACRRFARKYSSALQKLSRSCLARMLLNHCNTFQLLGFLWQLTTLPNFL